MITTFGLLLSCGTDNRDARSNANHQLHIVATTSMITDLATIIGGEHAAVTGLMGPGIDPHLYKASEGDLTRLSEADVILYNGLHLEGAMNEVFERMRRRKRTIAIAAVIDEAELLTPPEFKGAHDPHIWFDVALWRQVARGLADSLAAIDTVHAEDYRGNVRDYLVQLDSLHAYVGRRAAFVPQEQRVLVTAHDAFNYFGRAYGFEVRGLQGISTATEAGTADVQELAQFIADRRIPAIFVESSVPVRSIQAVQAAVQSRGFAVEIGGELYSDALGNPGTPDGNYIGMVRHNIDTIVDALLGRNSPHGDTR